MGNGGVYYIHDNRIHDNYDCEELQIGNPGETDYVWNNIWYNPGPRREWPQVPQSETPIAMYFLNNTIVDWRLPASMTRLTGIHGPGPFIRRITCASIPAGSSTSGNPSANPAVISNNIGMTDSQAASAGYTNSEAIPYSPTSSSSPTVGAGANLASLWPAGFSNARRWPDLHAANGEHRGSDGLHRNAECAAGKRRMGCGSLSIQRGFHRASRILRQVSKRPSSESGRPQEKSGFLAQARQALGEECREFAIFAQADS